MRIRKNIWLQRLESFGKKVKIEYCERVREIVSVLAKEGGSVKERNQKSLYHLSHKLVSQILTSVKSSVKKIIIIIIIMC